MDYNERAVATLADMTLEEKAGLCSGDDFWHTKSVTRLGIDKMMLTDGPHGLRRQVGDADHLGLNKSVPSTCFPAGATVACSWDRELIRRMGEHIGNEARSEGVNVVLGPAINIKRNPLCGRNFEYLSEDPYLAGQLAASYIQGMQSMGISACPKHFAVNNQERLRMVIDAVVDERALREIYLLPFEYAVKDGKAKTIMSSYNKVNGDYANENRHLLHDILRDEWGFEGMVVTDWGGCNDRVAGLLCGNQLEMPGNKGETDRQVLQAVRDGVLTEQELDKLLLPLVSLAIETSETLARPSGYSVEEHHDFAREVAHCSMVLLKNENNTLPLAAGTAVAVIGDFASTARYQGAGSSIINPTKLESPLEELRKSGLNVTGYAEGYNRFGKRDSRKLRQAVAIAKTAQTVLLFLGLDESTEAEGLDRKNMLLPQVQLDLLGAVAAVNPHVVVVLSGGAPVEMDWDDKATAVLGGYLGGQAGGSAIADLLCGKVNPSGKLAESYPIHYNDLPSAGYYLDGDKATDYRESIFVGYRYFDTAGVAVKYPFGHGLSYTTFDYSDLAVEGDRVTFTVRNSGAVYGAEVAELYISAQDSAAFRPAKELKGFAKVSLAAGEAQSVEILLDDKAFAYYNTEQGGWCTESGSYEILVGASSADIRLRQTVQRSGTVPADNMREHLPSYYSGRVSSVSDEEYTRLLGRPMPPKYWDVTERVGFNSSLRESAMHKGAGRLLYRVVQLCEFASRRNVYYNAAIKAAYDMPYRALAGMTDGMLSIPMVEGILTMINESFFKGFRKFNIARRIKKQQGRNRP